MSAVPKERDGTRTPGLNRFLKLLPLYVTYAVVIVTWLAFLGLVTIREVLLRRHDTWRFIEQAVLLDGLFGLTLVALITASTRPPGRPDPTLAPARAREKPQSPEGDWDDDIPLRTLRDARHRLTLSDTTASEIAVPVPSPASTGEGPTPQATSFPLSAIPFVPKSTSDAGEAEDRKSGEGSGDLSVEVAQEEGPHDETALLFDSPRHTERSTLFAKSSSGGIRWCKKCNAWKPDRCHHCRHCRQCTLKMDHHCVWLATCIGHNNYKPFLLFATYGTLLALYILVESVICLVQYLSDPRAYPTPTANDMGSSEIMPVTFMLLTILGGFFTLTIGGLAVYHWHLACSNKTTLEDISRDPPAIFLYDQITDHPLDWRGDHLLSRPERVRLRNEASKLNVYDIGWRRNLASIFCPGRRITPWVLLTSLWPPTVLADRLDTSRGHYFDHDPIKLERLRELTVELRTHRSGHLAHRAGGELFGGSRGPADVEDS